MKFEPDKNIIHYDFYVFFKLFLSNLKLN